MNICNNQYHLQVTIQGASKVADEKTKNGNV